MAVVRLETSGIVGWESFHAECASAMGFPDYYGRNMDAWIDCMDTLEHMTRFEHIQPGEMLLIEVADFEAFQTRWPEIAKSLTECTAFVNRRSARRGDPPRLALVPL